MTARRNPSLFFTQVLLWLVALAGLLSPLSTPFVDGPDSRYWLTVARSMLVGALAAAAAILIKKRSRRGPQLVYLLAALAIVPPLVLQRSLPLVPILVWAGIIALILKNQREFGAPNVTPLNEEL